MIPAVAFSSLIIYKNHFRFQILNYGYRIDSFENLSDICSVHRHLNQDLDALNDGVPVIEGRIYSSRNSVARTD